MKGHSYYSCQPTRVWRILKHFISFTIVILSSHNLFSQTPTISSFSPTSAAKGNTVVIIGTNLSGATSVSFAGTAASSFTVISATQINAVVPNTTSGSVSVTTPVQTVTSPNFYYLPLSGITTDFAGYWPTTTINNNSVRPDNSHNLLSFTYNGTTYSTGVNNATLTGQGVNYTAGSFKSLPVAGINGTNNASSTFLAMASNVDGNSAIANASVVSNITIKEAMTDGINGLNMGTGVTNLPATANMDFDIHIINPAKILDAEPDILITQIADPSSGNDVFQFIDATGATIGNSITQDMTMLTILGTYSLDLFTLSPGAPFNSATGFGVSVSPPGVNTTRNIRMAGFKLSDFGISLSNYLQVAALRITPSGTSDYAFIAYNTNAIDMSPNIDIYVDRTNSSVCAGGTANLEVIATAAYGGQLTYAWEVSSNGGTSWLGVANGGSYSGATTKRLSIANPTNAYKYRASVTEAGTGYISYSDLFIIAVITPAPPSSASVAANTTTCLDNLVSLSCTVTGGSNLFYQWQSNNSGSYVTIPDAIIKTYLPPVNATGVISYRLVVSSGSGCSGAVTTSPAIITVVGISSTTPAARCGTGLVSLGATATSGTISWYNVSTGGTALATGKTYSPSIAGTTIFYVSSDVCTSGNRVPIVATINSIIWAGTNTSDWSTLANWDCGGTPPSAVPSASNNVMIPTEPSGGRFPVVNTVAPINTIGISPGASLTVASTGVFEIYGGINNLGTFIATSGTISMRGSSQQTIPANAFSTNTIKNLVINNTAGVLIGGELNLTGTYTPTAGVLTTFGYLTLKSDSNGTAKVANGTSPYIIGNVNVERYMPEKRSWRMMTSPLTNSNTIFAGWQNGGVYAVGKGLLVTAPGGGSGIDASGNSSMKTWNVSTQRLVPVMNTNTPISASNNGSGDNTAYFIFVRGDREWSNIDPNGIKKNITTLTSTGYLQTGTQNFTNLSTVPGGFSMVGNPFASPIDWNLVIANAGTTNLKRKFYVWDPKFNLVGGYTVLDDVLSPGTFSPTPVSSSQNKFIQSSQAIFVITNTNGPAAIQIQENNKAGTNNTVIFGRPMGTNSSFITSLFLVDTLNNATVEADGTRADFGNNFFAGVDDDDNIKCYNVNETFGLLRNNIFLATERRPAIIKNDTLFFKLVQTATKPYQLQFTASGLNDAGLTAVLEDSYTHLSTPLSLNGLTKVNFSINTDAASQYDKRFRVIFAKSSTLPVTFSSVKASYQGKSIEVIWNVENEININTYEVEKSGDGISFSHVNTTAATGNNLASKTYHWIDATLLNGENYYRIKSIGVDGLVQFSQVVKVSIKQRAPSFIVFPNPVADQQLCIQFNNQPVGKYTMKLSNNAGQVLLSHLLAHTGGTSIKTLNLPGSITTGNYQLTIFNGQSKSTSLKVLVK
ncbi:MAG: T9SS type A sorting domain-containing protein [Ferruginibacter sp.]